MIQKFGKWLAELSRVAKVILVTASLIGLSAAASQTNHTPQSTILNTKSSSSKSQDSVTHKILTTTENIPFATTTVDDDTLANGTTLIRTAGVNGTRTYTYEITLTNGVETARKEVSNTITTQPVSKVIAIGTYIAPAQPYCPEGTYVNTYGNTVCRPYSSPSIPAGATAQCVDGTYSYSQSRSGTCSHHGGVATWL